MKTIRITAAVLVMISVFGPAGPAAGTESPSAKTAVKTPVEASRGKFDFEVAVGLGLTDSGALYDRASGIDSLMDQYVSNYAIDPVSSGEFKKNFLLLPLQATVHYRLSRSWFIKGGLEFGTGGIGSEKTFSVDWEGPVEVHAHDLSTKISYLMPYVGVETRFSAFGFYGAAGLGFLSLSDTSSTRIEDGSYAYTRDDEIHATGVGPGLLLGGKYRIRLGRKTDMVVKLELAYITCGSLKGDRKTEARDTMGATFNESVDGTIYGFETDPYGLGWYRTWELLAVPPSGGDVRDVGEIRLALSSVRLLVGIAF